MKYWLLLREAEDGQKGERRCSPARFLCEIDSCWSLADMNSALLMKGGLAPLAGLGILIVSS